MKRRDLSERYRPRTFDEVVGNDKAVATLRGFLADPFGAALLLEGPSGIGKTSCAEIVGRELANPANIRRINGADLDQRTCQQIRMDWSLFPWDREDGSAGRHVVLVDEADRMTDGARVALLSLIEQAPDSVVLIFTSNESHRFEDRLLRRMVKIHFSTQGMRDPGTQRLCEIAAAEGIDLPESTLRNWLKGSENNLGDAIEKLQATALMLKGQEVAA
jgi:DNA polymerase III delta prime subunit